MRRSQKDAAEASAAATEAARTLAARSHEARSEPKEIIEHATVVERSTEKTIPQANPDRVEKLLKNRPHSMAMDEIISKRGLDVEDEPEEKKPEEVAPVASTEPVVETKAPEAPPVVTEAPKAPEAPVMTKQVVDGEEFEVSQADIEEAGGAKAWRIAKANENRLKKTNDTLAQVKQMLAEGFKQQQPKPTEAPDEELLKFLESKIDLERFGTPAEAARAKMEAARELMRRMGPQQQDPQAIIQQATNVMENRRAVEDFKKEFSDVVTNPMLNRLAISLEREYMAKLPTNQSVDWGNFYRRIGNEIRTVLPRQSQPPAGSSATTAGNPSQPSAKEERKASITTLPTSSARAEAPREEKELSPEEERKAWIAEQKKARGQA
jgi:hypothetical protein